MRLRFLVLTTLALATTLCWAEPDVASRSLICVDRDSLVQLLDQYDEQPLLGGSTDQGWVIVYANPQTHSWTIIERVQGPRGTLVYCVLAVGDQLSPVPQSVLDGFQEQRRQRRP